MSRKSKPHSKGLKPYIYRGFFRCENVDVSLPPSKQKVITICDVPNGKILVLKNMSAKNSSLLKFKMKSKSFFATRLAFLDDCRKCKDGQSEVNRVRFCRFYKSRYFSFGFQNREAVSAYLESALSLEEYREAKNKLVNQISFSKRNYRLSSKSE